MRSSNFGVRASWCAVVVATIASFWAVDPANAANVHVWNGSVDSTYTNAANWNANNVAPSNSVVLTNNDRISVQNGANNQLIYSAAQGHTIFSSDERSLFIGSGGAGSMTITGGIFESRSVSQDGITNHTSTSSLTIAGGSYVNTNGTGAREFLVLFGGGGTAVLNVNSGSFSANTVRIGSSGGSTGNGIINLNGGLMSVGTIVDSGATPVSTINFNGGTLQARSNNTNWLQNINNANLQAGGAIFDTNGFNVTINSTFQNAGGGGITKIGSGRLEFGGNNSAVAGPINLNQGDIFLLSANSGSAAAAWNLNNATSTMLINGDNAGTGNVVNLGSLSGVPGSTLRNGGSVVGPNTYSIGALGTNTTFAGNITDGTVAGVLTAVQKVGGGTLTLTGNNTYTGGTTVNGGTLAATLNTTQNSVSTGAVSIGGSGTLQLNNTSSSGSTTFANTVTGTGKLNMNFLAAGSARNSFITGLSGFNGTVELTTTGGATGDKWNASVNSPGTSVIVNPGTQLFAVGTNTFDTIYISGTGNTESRGAIRLNGGTLNGNIVLLGSANIGTANETMTGNITSGAAGTQTLTFGAPSQNGGIVNVTGTVGGGIGDVAITKFGSGVLNLTGNNTYAGGTNITGGTVIGTLNTSQNSLGTGPVSIGGGTTLQLNNTSSSGTTTFANTVTGTGTLNMNFLAGGSARNTSITGLSGFNGTVALTTTGSATGDKWNTNGLNAPGTSVIVNPGTQLFAVGTSTFDTIYINGTGNTESRGAIRLNGGTLNGDIVLLGSANIGTANETLTGNISTGVAGTQTLTFGAPSQSTGTVNVTGNLTNGTGVLALTKVGTGDVIMTGSNTYTGNTLVNAGRLTVNGSSFGTGNVTVASGAEAFIANSGTLNNNFFISGNGGNSSLDSQPRGALRIENTTIGAAGSVTLLGDASLGSYNNGTGTVLANIGESGGSRSLSINVSGANSPGTIILGGNNTYTGSTTVNNGTLVLNGSLQNSNTSVASGATFVQNGGANNITGTGSNPHLFVATGGTYTLNNGILDFQDHLPGGTASTLEIDGTFNFNGGTLIDVSTIDPSGGSGLFTQGGGNFFVGRDGTDVSPVQTLVSGSFDQLGPGTLNLDVFGAASDQIDMLLVDGDVDMAGSIIATGLQDFIWYDAVKTLQAGQTIDFSGSANGLYRVITNANGTQTLQLATPEPGSVLVWLLVGLAAVAIRRRKSR